MGTASPISSIIVMGLVFIFGKILQYFHVEKDDKDGNGDAKVTAIFEQFDSHGMMIENRNSFTAKEAGHQLVTPRKSLVGTEYSTVSLNNSQTSRRRMTDII